MARKGGSFGIVNFGLNEESPRHRTGTEDDEPHQDDGNKFSFRHSTTLRTKHTTSVVSGETRV